ncbi:hypothetical protein MRX96_015601 [Rhipicephalus microplus]
MPKKRPRTDATLPSYKASDCKQQRRECPSPKAGGQNGNIPAMSRWASSSPERAEQRRNAVADESKPSSKHPPQQPARFLPRPPNRKDLL